jgi:hypothetical protein
MKSIKLVSVPAAALLVRNAMLFGTLALFVMLDVTDVEDPAI